MTIIELLERNAREWPDDTALVEINPDPTINGVFPNMTQEKMAYLFALLLFDMGK